jgi:hypothetical protein
MQMRIPCAQSPLAARRAGDAKTDEIEIRIEHGQRRCPSGDQECVRRRCGQMGAGSGGSVMIAAIPHGSAVRGASMLLENISIASP